MHILSSGVCRKVPVNRQRCEPPRRMTNSSKRSPRMSSNFSTLLRASLVVKMVATALISLAFYMLLTTPSLWAMSNKLSVALGVESWSGCSVVWQKIIATACRYSESFPYSDLNDSLSKQENPTLKVLIAAKILMMAKLLTELFAIMVLPYPLHRECKQNSQWYYWNREKRLRVIVIALATVLFGALLFRNVSGRTIDSGGGAIFFEFVYALFCIDVVGSLLASAVCAAAYVIALPKTR